MMRDDIEDIRNLIDQLEDATEDEERQIVQLLREYIRDARGVHDRAMIEWHERRRPDVLAEMRHRYAPGRAP